MTRKTIYANLTVEAFPVLCVSKWVRRLAKQKNAEDRNQPSVLTATGMMMVANLCQIIALVARSLVNHSASITHAHLSNQ